MAIPTPKYYAIRAIAAIVPSMTIQAGVDSAGMSHDKEEVQKYLDDPLVHDFATLSTCKMCLFAYLNQP